MVKPEYYFREGCFIEEWLNTPDHEAMSVARVRVRIGTSTRLHALKSTVERYLVLSGTGLVTVGEDSWEVTAKSVVVIAADAAQKIRNTGNTDLIFLAICTPRFKLENYRELGR